MSTVVTAKRMPRRGKAKPVPVPPTQRHAATAALWLLVASLIFFLPDAFVRWFLPKDALAAIAIMLASVAVARGRLPRWFVASASAALALTLLGVLISVAPGVQIMGRWPRYEGLVTLPVYFGSIWAGARLLGPAAPAHTLRTLMRAVAAAAIALGLVSLLETAGARPIATDLARPGSLTGNATDQGVLGALFCAMLILPVLRAWTRASPTTAVERAWLSVALLLSVFTVIGSASRAGLLAAGTALVVLLALEMIRAERGIRLRILAVGAAGAAVLAAGALALPLTRERVFGTSPLAAQSLEGRFTFWQNSLALLADHPLGVGVSGFLNADAVHANTDSIVDSPHNWVFQVLLAGGIPLLVVVVAGGAAVITSALRTWSRTNALSATSPPTDAARADIIAGALAALSGYGLALLTHFTAPSTTILAALLIGVLVAQSPRTVVRSPSGSPQQHLARSRTIVLAAWAVWLAVLAGAELPLAAGVANAARGDLLSAQAAFESAHSLRPWDADLTGIAAQSFAAAASAGIPGAAPLAISWAERSRAALPSTVSTERALAVAQFANDDSAGAARTLEKLTLLAPNDPALAVQNAIVLYTTGDLAGANREVQRALALDPENETGLQLEALLLRAVPVN